MTDNVIPLGPPDDDREDRDSELPEHERDSDATVGGGMMSSGGTATDRGTGELDGTAQGPDTGADDDDLGGVGGGMIAGTPTGGAQPYVHAFVDDKDEDADVEGGALPDA